MNTTDKTDPLTGANSPSLSQLLARGLMEISEVINMITLDLLRAEGRTIKPQGMDEPRKHNLRIDDDSIDRVLSQGFRIHDLAELLGTIHSSIFGTVLLMRNMDGDSALPGFAIQMIGNDIQKKLDLLLSIQNYCEELKTK